VLKALGGLLGFSVGLLWLSFVHFLCNKGRLTLFFFFDKTHYYLSKTKKNKNCLCMFFVHLPHPPFSFNICLFSNVVSVFIVSYQIGLMGMSSQVHNQGQLP
jgi:hypothetical protein